MPQMYIGSQLCEYNQPRKEWRDQKKYLRFVRVHLVRAMLNSGVFFPLRKLQKLQKLQSWITLRLQFDRTATIAQFKTYISYLFTIDMGSIAMFSMYEKSWQLVKYFASMQIYKLPCFVDKIYKCYNFKLI